MECGVVQWRPMYRKGVRRATAPCELGAAACRNNAVLSEKNGRDGILYLRLNAVVGEMRI